MVQKIAMAVHTSGSDDIRVVKSAECLAKEGFDVHVVCILKDGFTPFEKINRVTYHRIPLSKGFKKSSPPILILKKFLGRNFKNIFPRSYVKNVFANYFNVFHDTLLKLNADIYYAHEIWSLESCYVVSKQKLKKKLIYDSHELEMYRNNNWTAKENIERMKYEKNYINHVDHVLTVSESCAKIITKNYNLKNKITILKNAPILNDMRKASNPLRKLINVENDKKIMVYTGLCTFDRGIDLIVNALIKLPKYHLATVGNWNDAYKKKNSKNYRSKKVV